MIIFLFENIHTGFVVVHDVRGKEWSSEKRIRNLLYQEKEKRKKNRTDLAECDGAWGAEMWGACGLWIQIQQDLLMFWGKGGTRQETRLGGFLAWIVGWMVALVTELEGRGEKLVFWELEGGWNHSNAWNSSGRKKINSQNSEEIQIFL